jgi:hypothetical protein
MKIESAQRWDLKQPSRKNLAKGYNHKGIGMHLLESLLPYFFFELLRLVDLDRMLFGKDLDGGSSDSLASASGAIGLGKCGNNLVGASEEPF